MKLRSFKSILKEAQDKQMLNAFVEDCFAGKWNETQTNFGNFTDDFSCKGGETLFRIIFFSKEEINQLARAVDLKIKIKALLTDENKSHPRFYTKDEYEKIKDHLSYLSSIGEKIHGYTDEGAEQRYMGIIISKNSNQSDNVDFSNYDGKGGNAEIKQRIERTLPVLSINDPDKFKIVANLEFVNREGWTIGQFTDNDIQGPEEEPEETEQPQETEEEPIQEK
jgi:hypothetical protein